jgi:hypothetical protein
MNGEYIAVITDARLRTYIDFPRAERRIACLDVTFAIQSPPFENRTVVRTYHPLKCDANANIDFANFELDHLREVLGQNNPFLPWAPALLPGTEPLRVRITPKLAEGSQDVAIADLQVIAKCLANVSPLRARSRSFKAG